MDTFMGNETLTNDLFLSIKKGLSIDPYNYKLYESLATYYSLIESNHQAYIALTQARFYCSNENEKSSIDKKINDLNLLGYSVPKTAIIILSWNLKDFTMQCINSIRQTTPIESREIIVVDNGSTDGSAEWLQAQDDIICQCNQENHGFPQGCNEGIALASKDADIFLLNNDTVLPPNALFWIKIGLYESDTVGATGSRSNYVSNYQAIEETFSSPSEVIDYATKTNIPQLHPYESKIYLVGFALLLKRTVLNQTGLLDERFSPGNSEDVDICLRVRQAGYDVVLCRNSVILHFGSQSFQKLGDKFREIMLQNIDRICDKYQMDIRALCTPYTECLHAIEKNPLDTFSVLIIGSYIGATLAQIKGHFPNASLYGIETEEKAFQIFSSIRDIQLFVGNPDEIISLQEQNYFDYCLIIKNSEIPYNIESLKKNMYPHLNPEGNLIVFPWE